MFFDRSALHRVGRTEGYAFVNGIPVRFCLDTGASTSMLSLKAAKRAGLVPGGEGVWPAGLARGVGKKTTQSWIAPVRNFTIAGEKISNTHLRIGDMGDLGIDMVLGADFLLSHHVYVANGQGKLYFTYNGGAVFNLAIFPGSLLPAGGDDADVGEQRNVDLNVPTDLHEPGKDGK
jgi:hypothetical protein